jgi:hypothetical protein
MCSIPNPEEAFQVPACEQALAGHVKDTPVQPTKKAFPETGKAFPRADDEMVTLAVTTMTRDAALPFPASWFDPATSTRFF